MPIYKVNNQKLDLVLEDDFKKKKDLQKFIEQNLKEILNLKFIATEFTVGSFRNAADFKNIPIDLLKVKFKEKVNYVKL